MELTTEIEQEIKLDLGSGNAWPEGFQGVDMYAPEAQHKVNLFQFPWPWETGSVAEVRSSHFVEHIPMCFVSGGQIPKDENDLDLWCAFFSECWRVMKEGAHLTVQVPYLQSHRAFQDPTHRRFHCEANFNYLNKPWREANGIAHYLGTADFDILSIDRVAPQEEGVKHPEVSQMRALNYWNTTWDIIAHMVARKVR